MSHGVKIILERLRDFPADFATSGPYLSVGRYHSNTWVDMAAHIIDRKEVFTDEERKAVRDALRIAQRLQFDAAVMDLLAKPAKSVEENEEKHYQLRSPVIEGAVIPTPEKRRLETSDGAKYPR